MTTKPEEEHPAVALLRELEWSGPNEFTGDTRPACNATPDEGHDADCKLAALIGKQPASVTVDPPVAKFQIWLGYSPTMDEATRIRRAINAAHGLPNGVPIGQRFPREVEAAQEKAGWGARTIEMSAWLTVAKDGTMQIALGDNDDGNNDDNGTT